MLGKFIIVDATFKPFKDQTGQITYFDSFDDAATVCGMYEFETAFVIEVKGKYTSETDRTELPQKAQNIK